MVANKVELIGWYGSDKTHACSAWTSTDRDLTPDKEERIDKLLAMLAKEGHHTPFEKSSLHFLVTSDIASHIHILKHRIGVSVNAESARYKELKEDKYYLPDDWGNAHIVWDEDNYPVDDYAIDWSDAIEDDDTNFDPKWINVLKWYTNLGNYLYHNAVKDLTPILGRKRAKESARFFKTYNSQITCDVMFNWRSFYHFQSLRNKPDAQKEIREIANTMLELVKSIDGNPFKHTIEAFGL